MENISLDLNNKNTWIFVSMGGNNLLELCKKNPKLPMTNIQDEYKECILELQKKYDKTHIVLLNLYYPANPLYSIFYPQIKTWNSFLDTLNFPVLSLDFLKEDDDFIDSIEPSVKGGKLIVEHILKFIQ